ncbi:hypothetical protein RAS2_33430 [Phycisphaerae bacterium RAS2]|nr:hypothetical protein RAS2_33430 [Phycisphaerae bacterium RAS2]
MTNDKTRIGTICMALVAIVMSLPATAAAQSNESFRPVVWTSALIPSDLVEYSAEFQSSGESQSHFFLNVVRNDGTWVVQNLPVGYEPGLSRIATVIPASVFLTGETYHTTFLKDYAIEAPPFVADQAVIHLIGQPVNYLTNGGSCRDGYGSFADPGAAPSFPLQFTAPPPPPLPPIDVTYHKGVPDLAQGPNECGPTSVANSLTWLDNEHDSVTTNMTTAGLRDTLKDAGHMMTDPNSGTSDENFLAGKQALVNELGLPIDTTTIGGGPGSLPSGDNIKKALAEGADVELSVLWTGGGGHWVTVVGAINFGSQCGVWINDPDDGVEQAQFHFLDTRSDGKMSLRGYGGGNTVDLTIAEKVRPPSLLATLFPFCGFGGLMPLLAIPVGILAMRRSCRKPNLKRSPV